MDICSVPQSHKVTYLGLSSVLGLDLPSGLKTLAKSGYVHPFASPTVEDHLERLKWYMKSCYNNLLPIVPTYCLFTALACIRMSKEVALNSITETVKQSCTFAMSVQLKLSSDLGGYGWPSIVQVNLQDSCGTSEAAFSSVYASLFAPNLPADSYKKSLKAYAGMTRYGTNLKMTKRSAFEAMRNSYSVRPKIPSGGRVEVEKYARDRATEDITCSDLNCGSLVAKQHSQNFDEGLMWWKVMSPRTMGSRSRMVRRMRPSSLWPHWTAVSGMMLSRGWMAFLKIGRFGCMQKFGDGFMRKCVETLQRHLSSGDALTREISWIEVATWFHLELGEMPIPHHSRKGSWMFANDGAATSQTLAAIVRLVKDFFKELAFCFELEIPNTSGISRLCLKIHTPLQGTLVRIREARYQEIVQTLLKFNARRPIRRANDLTRPLPRWSWLDSSPPLRKAVVWDLTDSPRV